MRRMLYYLFYVLVVFLLLALPSAVRWLGFNQLGGADRQEPPEYQVAGLEERVPTPAAAEFVDEPTVGAGQVLLDLAHDNLFSPQEISYLESRLAARGFDLVPFKDGDLGGALRPVSSLIVIAPLIDFSQQEILAVTDFVDRGGRLFLVGDPTRFNLVFQEDEADLTPFGYEVASDQLPLNSLANAFDLNYNGDYVYNTVENEGNFRNIILKGENFIKDEAFTEGETFTSDSLTSGLGQLVFYGSHSIEVGEDGRPLLPAGEDTWSSATDRPGDLALAAFGRADRVLAVGDVDFLTGPYYTVFDNARFIAQIADFLTADERSHSLADFPYFLDPAVDLVYLGQPELGADAFDEIIAWQGAFRQLGTELSLAKEAAAGQDTLLVGLYNQAWEVAELLDSYGVTLVIDPPIDIDLEDSAAGVELEGEDGEAEEATPIPTPGQRLIDSPLGLVQMAGTALILFADQADQEQVVVLAASSTGLENTIDRLVDLMPVGAESTFADCLLQDSLALCPSGVADEQVEAELVTSGAPEKTDEEAAESEEVPGEGEPSAPDAALQGEIGLGETLEASLEPGEAHAWTFSEGPAVVNITLQPEDPMDGILELYDEDGNLIAAVDSSFTAGEEILPLIEVPTDVVYTIVVRDFFEEGGDYALSVVGITPEDLGALDQGELPVGEPVEGVLDFGEAHAWTFVIGTPTEVDLTLTSGPDLDGLLILFDPDFRVLGMADETLEGGEERLAGIALSELGNYTLVVAEYINSGGSYTLLLELAE